MKTEIRTKLCVDARQDQPPDCHSEMQQNCYRDRRFPIKHRRKLKHREYPATIIPSDPPEDQRKECPNTMRTSKVMIMSPIPVET